LRRKKMKRRGGRKKKRNQPHAVNPASVADRRNVYVALDLAKTQTNVFHKMETTPSLGG
jgi:hypothetical protein